MTDESGARTPAGGGGEAGTGLDALTDEVLPALIARLRASRLGELEVRTAEWRIRIRRDLSLSQRAPGVSAGSGYPEAADRQSQSIARSSAVGYFTPVPGLLVGRSVQVGDLLGTIDVLGIVQEVAAPAEGIISAVVAEDGQAVEYGQALAEIDPLEPALGGYVGDVS